jgi:hypothetical protein
VIGAHRDTEAPTGSIDGFVATMARLSRARVLGAGLLSDAESERLLVNLLSLQDQPLESLASAIVRRAGGMPLFLVSFAEEIERHGESGVEAELPWSAVQVVRQRLAALSPGMQELLGVASVAAGTVEPDLLCDVTSRDEEEVLGALRVACHPRLLIDDRDGCRFAHDLARETIELDLSPGWRRLWHARLGAALGCLPQHERRGRTAEVAWHLDQAGDPEQALPWILRAGDEAAAAGHAVAQDRYERGIELARALGDERADAETCFKLADMQSRLGHYADALEPLERAAEIYLRLGERDLFLRMVARSGETYGLCGRAADGIERALPVLKLPFEALASPPAISRSAIETVGVSPPDAGAMSNTRSPIESRSAGTGPWMTVVSAPEPTIDTLSPIASSPSQPSTRMSRPSAARA